MKGLIGKPPQYLSTRPAGWQEKEQARLARLDAAARKRAALQAEVSAAEYRCGGLSDRERAQFREQVTKKVRGAGRWHGVASGK